MREGWTYKKLGEVCSFINDGDWIESKDQSESGIRLIQTGNIGNGEYKDKGERAKYISEETFSKLGCTEIFRGDCLVSRLPEPIGRCCILPELENRCITAVDCSILRFKDEITPQLFVYYSQSSKYAIDIANKTTGTTRKRISRKNLEGIQIPLPPKSQQEAIVSELDEINSLLALKREQLQTYDKLAQSLFYEMFGDPVENEKGWEVKKIKDVGKIATGSTPSTNDDSNWNGKINWVTPAELDGQFYYGETVRKITEKGAKGLTLMPKGTVLLSSRAPIGKLAITTIEMCCNQGFKNLICGSELNNIYAYYYLLLVMEKIIGLGRGATFKEVSKSAIESFAILVPPISLQRQFASRIEQIEEQKQQVQAAIERLETLLASRMQYWFD